MTSCYHGSTLSGWQQNQRRRRRQGKRLKLNVLYLNKQQLCTCITLAILHISFPSLHHYDMKLPNFTSSLYGRSRWTQHKNRRFLFLNLVNDRYGPIENFAKICQIKWNWIRSVKFETVRIDFLSDFIGLLSSKNCATMATWRKDFSSLLGVSKTNLPWGN